MNKLVAGALGAIGLSNRIRSPRRRPHTTSEAIAEQIIAAKGSHLISGPKKAMDLLRREELGIRWTLACGQHRQ